MLTSAWTFRIYLVKSEGGDSVYGRPATALAQAGRPPKKDLHGRDHVMPGVARRAVERAPRS